MMNEERVRYASAWDVMKQWYTMIEFMNRLERNNKNARRLRDHEESVPYPTKWLGK